MSEGLNQDNITPSEEPIESKEEVKKDFQGLLGSTKKFLNELLDIRGATDQEAAKEAIIADIPFKGHTSWILVCSIFIASVGLATNSIPVVIGAMLISPLMGPILGIGMSLAINDIDTLRRSLKNFTVMIVLSVLTAFLFFLMPFLHEETSELIARTEPTLLDVLIAFFGGLALVIARTKKGTIASVIFGVAIATALIPPLCTVGFGLAIGNMSYAWGAMYLFIINTIFIALATFLIIKLLRFPMVRYANSQRRRNIARIASLTALLVMIPAGWTFRRVLQKSVFEKQAKEFVQEHIESYQFQGQVRFLEDFTDIEYNDGEKSEIELVFMGNDVIPNNVITNWDNKKNEYSRLIDTELHIIQGAKNEQVDQLKYIDELYENQKTELLGKDEKIKILESEVNKLRKYSSKIIPFDDISKEARASYVNLTALEYGNALRTDFSKTDTLTIFQAKWKKNIRRSQIDADSKKLHNWLKIRLKDSTILLKELAEN